MTRRLADRRGRPRFEVLGELWGKLDTVVGMPVRNIAPGGALVHCAVPLQPESVHHVTVSCEGQQTAASVRVRHVRSVPDGSTESYLIGLEFLSVAPRLLEQIVIWTEAAKSPDEGVERI